MQKLDPPPNKQPSFFSEPRKDLPWLRIGASSPHSRASANPRSGKPSCPSKETTLICSSTRPPPSSYSKLRRPYSSCRSDQTVLDDPPTPRSQFAFESTASWSVMP